MKLFYYKMIWSTLATYQGFQNVHVKSINLTWSRAWSPLEISKFHAKTYQEHLDPQMCCCSTFLTQKPWHNLLPWYLDQLLHESGASHRTTKVCTDRHLAVWLKSGNTPDTGEEFLMLQQLVGIVDCPTDRHTQREA